jgi:adenylylsulfate kinase-like enzyme
MKLSENGPRKIESGCVIWLTGLSGTGAQLKKRLSGMPTPALILAARWIYGWIL